MSTTTNAGVDITDPATYANGIPHRSSPRWRTEPIARRICGRPFWAVTGIEISSR
jgi:hypothetical protein